MALPAVIPSLGDTDAANVVNQVEELHNGLQYFYDALGRRISSDGTEQLIYDQSGQVIEDRHITTDGHSVTVNTLEDFVWGAGFVNQIVLQDHYDASTETTTRAYAMQDANFNVVVITDDSGSVIDSFAYDQDGNLRSGDPASDGWLILWQGMRQVTIGSGGSATVLYESQSRFDNPQLGTWISPDPKQYVNGMNYYQMELGNPISNVDPSGLDTTSGATTTGGMMPVHRPAQPAALGGSGQPGVANPAIATAGIPVLVEVGTTIEAGGIGGGEVLGPIDAGVLIIGGVLIYVGSPQVANYWIFDSYQRSPRLRV
jgi:RHS repeat-associated protein